MSAARVRRGLVLLAVAGALAPGALRAADGVTPRVPVKWPDDTPCMTVVDRSQSPVVQFPYGIPYEDTEVTADEVPDSRRHQFIAFCRNHSPQAPLPTWLSWKDVEYAASYALADPADITDEDVLETHSVYKDCFLRITPDEARRPITEEEAAKGVEWDTTGLPAGPYIVQGYTWFPGLNIWSKRPGVFHVVDGPDLAATGPAAALTNLDDFMFGLDTLTLQGCARAMPGSTMALYWSLTSGAELDWKVYAEGLPIDGEAIEVPFTPPPEAIQETVALRLDITDPMQRTFTAYPLRLLTILPGGGGGTTGCSDSGSFLGGESCGDGGSSSGGGASTTGATEGSSGPGPGTGGEDSASSGQPQVDPPPVGCACRSGSAGAPWAWGGLVLLGLGRRRKARGSTLAPR